MCAGRPAYGNWAACRGICMDTAIRHGAEKAERFDAELTAWDLAGFVYGRHFYRLPDETAARPDDSGEASTAPVTQETWR